MTDPDPAMERLSAHIKGLRARVAIGPNVLLIQAPLFQPRTYDKDIIRAGGSYAYPPNGLLFIKTALAGRGLRIDLLDLNYEILRRTVEDPHFRLEQWRDILDQAIEERSPSVIGVACTCVPGHPSDPGYFFTDIMRRVRERTNAVVIAGGAIASSEHRFFLGDNLCDFVVAGEGEGGVALLMDRLAGRSSDAAACGEVCFRMDGEILRTQGGKNAGALGACLVDAYREFPLERYWGLGCLNPFSKMAGREARFANLQFHRGCRAHCRFCGLFEFMGPGVRERDPQAVVREIRYLVEERGVRHLDILDDDFLGTGPLRPGLLKVLSAMADLNARYGITWAAGNGLVAASLGSELLDLFEASGCIGFRIGIESGNEKMLSFLRRPSNLPALRRASRAINEHPRFCVSGNFIIGLFDRETFGEMMDTYRFAHEMNLDWAGYSVFQHVSKKEPAPGMPEHVSTHDFVPTRDNARRQVDRSSPVVTGPAVFDLPPGLVPSRDQVKEIWFAFNLMTNYVNNKNLRPGGHPEKYARWVEALFVSYPDNGYMPLFASLARTLAGDHARAARLLAIARGNVERSEYWRTRFREFGLDAVLDRAPTTADEVFSVIGGLIARCRGRNPEMTPCPAQGGSR